MHLSIKNYRGIQAAEIDAAPIAVLVGRGGSGKSSVAMAAAAVLTGATYWVENGIAERVT